ncbi:hypothetical protein CXZ10_13370 [Pleomorphomonas diazotrophica]|uniref:DUF1700 domain-containing protein n=1 Tax=Pleomorphomonas diazotrophica TaxID=1166257 RepID=A0A1I4V3S3_9HYPH|nr:DUF1700 domain-containing protein [Pleomorphomonas diazotrophica]PKR88731.1 hypothetical protein CXZ10_13370 [Pleomorphomonas diazotrophica]SFM95805.1 Uncharacterized membrane protein [Pleomorphomonas diazotrophica]
MTRDAFLHMLRVELAGLPPAEVDDILADYAAHFADAEGRSEEDVAAALGDPSRIARELRAEAGLRRLEAKWSLTNLAGAAAALAGLALLDIVLLLPLLLVTLIIAVGLAGALAVVAVIGVNTLLGAGPLPFGDPAMTGTLARLLIGAGLLSCVIGGGALLLMGLGTGVHLLGRYARLHFRLADRDTLGGLGS